MSASATSTGSLTGVSTAWLPGVSGFSRTGQNSQLDIIQQQSPVHQSTAEIRIKTTFRKYGESQTSHLEDWWTADCVEYNQLTACCLKLTNNTDRMNDSSVDKSLFLPPGLVYLVG